MAKRRETRAPVPLPAAAAFARRSRESSPAAPLHPASLVSERRQQQQRETKKPDEKDGQREGEREEMKKGIACLCLHSGKQGQGTYAAAPGQQQMDCPLF